MNTTWKCVFIGRMIKLGQNEPGAMWTTEELNEFLNHILAEPSCEECTLFHRGLYDSCYRDKTIKEDEQRLWNEGTDKLFKKHDPRQTRKDVWQKYEEFLSRTTQLPSAAKEMHDMFAASLNMARAARFLTRR